MVCLDTDVIINFLRNDKSSVELLKKMISEGKVLTTTAVNSFELWKGAYRSRSESGLGAVEKFLASVNIFSLDERSSKKAAEIFEGLASRGETVDSLDVLIGAIAIQNREKILTLNRKHFERIPGIELADLR